jgi:hypothetical protein
MTSTKRSARICRHRRLIHRPTPSTISICRCELDDGRALQRGGRASTTPPYWDFKTPLRPARSAASDNSPLLCASSTKRRRYSIAASRPFGIAIAICRHRQRTAGKSADAQLAVGGQHISRLDDSRTHRFFPAAGCADVPPSATASPRSCRGACWLPYARTPCQCRRMQTPCRSAVAVCAIPPLPRCLCGPRQKSRGFPRSCGCGR